MDDAFMRPPVRGGDLDYPMSLLDTSTDGVMTFDREMTHFCAHLRDPPSKISHLMTVRDRLAANPQEDMVSFNRAYTTEVEDVLDGSCGERQVAQ
jgi:hypothetical protein